MTKRKKPLPRLKKAAAKRSHAKPESIFAKIEAGAKRLMQNSADSGAPLTMPQATVAFLETVKGQRLYMTYKSSHGAKPLPRLKKAAAKRSRAKPKANDTLAALVAQKVLAQLNAQKIFERLDEIETLGLRVLDEIESWSSVAAEEATTEVAAVAAAAAEGLSEPEWSE